MQAGLDGNKKVVGWTQHVAGPAIVARFAPEGLLKNGVDPDIKEGVTTRPYAFPVTELRFMRQEAPGVMTAWWRGVGATRGMFVVETFMDELAVEAGQDPVAFRRAHITDPRALHVLDEVVRRSGWGGALPAGTGRGFAIQHSWETYLAAVIEARVEPSGEVRLLRAMVSNVPSTHAGLGLGARIFVQACIGCHTLGGAGRQNPIAALTGAHSVRDPAGSNLTQVMLNGSHIVTADGEAIMPGFSAGYTNEELAATADYVLEHFGGRTEVSRRHRWTKLGERRSGVPRA